ncbi:hypothetical protein M407DRAFT_19885 [Tulasnella calospora MUT 4182]|uniref:F-box domain-containing protein n=1 Tax=Tulasnella calospora MUT 4182 TaxID=1051891 RepID=A0A0C3LAU3_9AGAM|nr:hypothetical protein M407DRAFT_19885 [Tulasnella calospora MUT 4182]
MSEPTSKHPSDDKSNHTYHPSLDIPEILVNIFSKCNRSTNAASSLVCRRWSDVGVDQLWSSLPSLLPLLRILLPLVIVDDTLDFDREAGPPNWKRFWTLASRVRKLTQIDGPKGDTNESSIRLKGHISPNVISYLLLHLSWTGQQFLLPKLARLEWSVNWEHSMHQLCHFISPALRHLVIYLDKSFPADRVVRTLHSLASLPPLGITTLSISTNYPDLRSDLQVASAVTSFVKAQSTLLNLGFPSLWSRGQFVDGLTQHANLLDLELLLCFDTPLELGSFLGLVARQCPRLQIFTYTLPTRFPPLAPRHAIEPLLPCYMLRELQIFHQGGLSVDGDDIKRMGRAWRAMELLQLCAGAFATNSVGTPLVLLLEFAEEFSAKLRWLALNFSCEMDLPRADVVWASFPRLEVLGVGRSKPGFKALVIGEFLVSVCPEQTKLAYTFDNGLRPYAFDTIKWKTPPEASHYWVEVAAVMDCARRIQKAAVAKALKASEAKRT